MPYIAAADASGHDPENGASPKDGRHVLVQAHPPEDLIKRLKFALPEHEGRGKDGLLDTIQKILEYSVNTWDQGFLDKLYSSTNSVRNEMAPGEVSC